MYLVYPVDKGLGIVPCEATNHLNLIAAREYSRYQRDPLVRGESRTDQLFQGWGFKRAVVSQTG